MGDGLKTEKIRDLPYAFIPIFLMIAIRFHWLDGVGFAMAFAIPGSMVIVWSICLSNQSMAMNGWKRTVNWVFLCFGVIVCCLIVYKIETHPVISDTRLSNRVQWRLSRDSDFQSILIEPFFRKNEYVSVSGELQDEKAFLRLKKMLCDQSWKKVNIIQWSLVLKDTGIEVKEWESL